MDIKAVVYSRPACVACRHVKHHLSQLQVPFVERDADLFEEEILEVVETLGLGTALPFVEFTVGDETLYMTGNSANDLEALSYLVRRIEVAP